MTVVGGLELCGWDVAAVFVEASVVEPVDPFQGGDFDVVGGAPRSFRFDQFSLVEAVDGLGQGIVVAVAGGPDRGVDPGLEEAFGEGDRGVLRPAVVVMNQAGQVGDAFALAGPDGVLDGIEDIVAPPSS